MGLVGAPGDGLRVGVRAAVAGARDAGDQPDDEQGLYGEEDPEEHAALPARLRLVLLLVLRLIGLPWRLAHRERLRWLLLSRVVLSWLPSC